MHALTKVAKLRGSALLCLRGRERVLELALELIQTWLQLCRPDLFRLMQATQLTLKGCLSMQLHLQSRR